MQAALILENGQIYATNRPWRRARQLISTPICLYISETFFRFSLLFGELVSYLTSNQEYYRARSNLLIQYY